MFFFFLFFKFLLTWTPLRGETSIKKCQNIEMDGDVSFSELRKISFWRLWQCWTCNVLFVSSKVLAGKCENDLFENTCPQCWWLTYHFFCQLNLPFGRLHQIQKHPSIIFLEYTSGYIVVHRSSSFYHILSHCLILIPILLIDVNPTIRKRRLKPNHLIF